MRSYHKAFLSKVKADEDVNSKRTGVTSAHHDAISLVLWFIGHTLSLCLSVSLSICNFWEIIDHDQIRQ